MLDYTLLIDFYRYLRQFLNRELHEDKMFSQGLLDYQLVLRRVFLKYGLPLRLALDHDSVYYDSTSPSPYPSPRGANRTHF